MKNRKTQIFSFLLAALISFSSMNVLAASTETVKDGKNLKKTYSFTTRDTSKLQSEENENFPEIIKENGSKYRLKQVSYEVVDKKPVKTEKEVTKEIESDLIPVGDEFVPDQTIEENGVTYKYVSHTAIEDAAIETVTGFNDYSKSITASDVPATKEFPASDGTMVTCSLTGINQTSGAWENTYIDITFISYDADVFEWNGIEVAKNDSYPLQGYESQLLNSVGANANEYKINNISWSGDPYYKDGILCRNARASVQKYVKYYRANYSGQYKPGTKYKVLYEGVEEVEDGSEYEYEMAATAEYERQSISPVVIGVGIVILIGLIVLLLFLLAKKRKKDEEEK